MSFWSFDQDADVSATRGQLLSGCLGERRARLFAAYDARQITLAL
jgi:hypothetical protein